MKMGKFEHHYQQSSAEYRPCRFSSVSNEVPPKSLRTHSGTWSSMTFCPYRIPGARISSSTQRIDRVWNNTLHFSSLAVCVTVE